MRAPFSFLKPTSHSEKKAMDALAHDPGCPPPPPNKIKTKKKRTPPPQMKTDSEPQRMASTMAPTPQVGTEMGTTGEIRLLNFPLGTNVKIRNTTLHAEKSRPTIAFAMPCF